LFRYVINFEASENTRFYLVGCAGRLPPALEPTGTGSLISVFSVTGSIFSGFESVTGSSLTLATG
jgi:hypothetical protein